MLDTTTRTVIAGHQATADSASMASSTTTFASAPASSSSFIASSISYIASAAPANTTAASSNFKQCKGSDFWCNQELTIIILFTFAIIFALIGGILGTFYYVRRNNGIGRKKTKKKDSKYPNSFSGSNDPYAMGGYSEQNLGPGAGAHGQFADPGAGYEGGFDDPPFGGSPGMGGEFDDGVGYLAPGE